MISWWDRLIIRKWYLLTALIYNALCDSVLHQSVLLITEVNIEYSKIYKNVKIL